MSGCAVRRCFHAKTPLHEFLSDVYMVTAVLVDSYSKATLDWPDQIWDGTPNFVGSCNWHFRVCLDQGFNEEKEKKWKWEWQR